MPSPRSPAPPPRGNAGQAHGLALLGVLSILPPYLGPVVGLGLDVPADVEVVDHVVPGVAIALAAAVLARRGEEAEGSLSSLALAGLCFLGGLWQAATHFPLVLEGGGSEAPWGAVVLHSAAGPLVAAVALWLMFRLGRQEAFD